MSENIRPESEYVKHQSAADAVVEALVDEGVRFVFGMTGDTILPIIDAIHRRQDKIRYITTRVEMSAVSMADGYSRVTGGLGVVSMHVGPGARLGPVFMADGIRRACLRLHIGCHALALASVIAGSAANLSLLVQAGSAIGLVGALAYGVFSFDVLRRLQTDGWRKAAVAKA